MGYRLIYLKFRMARSNLSRVFIAANFKQDPFRYWGKRGKERKDISGLRAYTFPLKKRDCWLPAAQFFIGSPTRRPTFATCQYPGDFKT